MPLASLTRISLVPAPTSSNGFQSDGSSPAWTFPNASSGEFVGDGEALASRLGEEPAELSAGGIGRSLLIFAAVIEERSTGFFRSEGSLWRSRMNSPPSTHILSTCFWIVFGDRSDAARCSRNGRIRTSNCSPGGRSFSSPIHERGQPVRSLQHC